MIQEEGSAPAASNQAGDGEGGNGNPSMYNDELGKPPPLDPSMEDGAVTAPMPTPPVDGRAAAAAMSERAGCRCRAATRIEGESCRR